MSSTERKRLLIAGGVLIAALALLVFSKVITTAEAINITLVSFLVFATFMYAKRTAETANAAKQQADASVKMAEEMREQRVMASRPVIIQRAVYKESDWTDLQIQWIGIERSDASYFSHFEVYNAGNGSAIEVEISLLNKEKTPLHSIRQTFLRADETPIKFRPFNIANLEESTTYYLLCEYQSILSRSPQQQTWYQTWLPFEPVKSSKEDEIFVKAGELQFSEVSERGRIDAFGSRSKPK